MPARDIVADLNGQFSNNFWPLRFDGRVPLPGLSSSATRRGNEVSKPVPTQNCWASQQWHPAVSSHHLLVALVPGYNTKTRCVTKRAGAHWMLPFKVVVEEDHVHPNSTSDQGKPSTLTMTIEEHFGDHQAELSYLPVIVRYAQGMPKRPWEVLPGVTLMPTPKALKKVFDNPSIAKHTFGSGNYTIRVDKQRYLLHAKKRLHQFADGQSSDFYAQKIAKNLLLSVSLECPNTGFIVGGHFHGREENGHFITRGYSNIPSGRFSGHEELSAYRISCKPEPKLNRKNAILNFRRLEQYFLSPMTGNVVFIKSDRVAVAAQGIWAALSTPYDDQAFITFAMVLEALLTTDSAELTHQIAERAAILVGKSPTDRYELFRSVKRLYGIRSKIVHGTGIMKRKAKEKINIHPSFNVVPSEALREIGAIAIRVLRAVLHNDKLYVVVQVKDQAKLDEYYVTRMLS